jgi:cystathionine beta-lyase/cystathionine gamma-synthase
VKRRPPAGTDSRAVHAGKMSDPSGSLVDPIFQTAPYSFSGTDALDRAAKGDPPDSYYGRDGNRNWTAAERKLAALEGAEDAVVFGSGMAAITTAFLAHLKPGDHVVATEDLYGGAVAFFREVLEPMGVQFTFLRTEPEPPFEDAIRRETRWIYLESPTNPLVKIVDLERAGGIARRRGVFAVLDGTFGSPVLQQPLSLGFDLVLHSATKYLNGHGDLMAGFAVGSAAMLEPIRKRRLRTGGIIDPHAAFLLTRGMKTVGLRVRAQSENALRVAQLLARTPAVEKVHYPGLAAHPGHETARRQMSAFGAMLAFDVRGGLPSAKEFLSRLELISLATSLGSVETTADFPWLTSHRFFAPEKKRELGIQEGTIRLSVGIENFEDLREDLESALRG